MTRGIRAEPLDLAQWLKPGAVARALIAPRLFVWKAADFFPMGGRARIGLPPEDA